MIDFELHILLKSSHFPEKKTKLYIDCLFWIENTSTQNIFNLSCSQKTQWLSFYKRQNFNLRWELLMLEGNALSENWLKEWSFDMWKLLEANLLYSVELSNTLHYWIVIEDQNWMRWSILTLPNLNVSEKENKSYRIFYSKWKHVNTAEIIVTDQLNEMIWFWRFYISNVETFQRISERKKTYRLFENLIIFCSQTISTQFIINLKHKFVQTFPKQTWIFGTIVDMITIYYWKLRSELLFAEYSTQCAQICTCHTLSP